MRDTHGNREKEEREGDLRLDSVTYLTTPNPTHTQRNHHPKAFLHTTTIQNYPPQPRAAKPTLKVLFFLSHYIAADRNSRHVAPTPAALRLLATSPSVPSYSNRIPSIRLCERASAAQSAGISSRVPSVFAAATSTVLPIFAATRPAAAAIGAAVPEWLSRSSIPDAVQLESE